MAQLLIFKRDNFNAKNDIGSYKIGDVVLVAEDSHEFSEAEKKHPFAVVTVKGAKAAYEYLTADDSQLKIPKSVFNIPAMRRIALSTTAPTMERRRRYQYINKIVSKDHA